MLTINDIRDKCGVLCWRQQKNYIQKRLDLSTRELLQICKFRPKQEHLYCNVLKNTLERPTTHETQLTPVSYKWRR